MNQASEQIRRANQAGMQAFETVVGVTFDAIEKMAALNLGMVKSVLEQRETTSRNLFAATNPESLVSLQAGALYQSSQQAMDYSQRALDIGNATRDSLTRMFTEQIPGISPAQRKTAA